MSIVHHRVNREIARARGGHRRRRYALLAGSALVVGQSWSGCRPADELPALDPELRARVEELKRDIAREPTRADNVYERTEVLWPWANALGMAGVEIPIDLPLHVAMVRWAEADGGEPELPPGLNLPLAVHVPRIDGYLRELALKEERPGALGVLAFSPSEPLVSGERVTLEESYRVGEATIGPGGGFLLAKSWVTDELRLQHADPAAPNFVTARSSRAGIVFAPMTVPWTGIHGSTRGPEDLPGFRVVEGVLEPGDVVTFTLGDRSAGSPGLEVPTYSVDRFIVPIYVDLDGSGNFLTSKWPQLEIVGRPEVRSVRLFAPSVTATDESFAVTVRSEDRAMNRASGGVPGYELRLAGEVVAELAAGGEALAVVEGLRIAEPGIARLEVHSTDGALHAASNPIRVEDDPQLRIFWGDTHGHTSLAEGQGTARAYFEYARDDARLDFVTLSEHDIWMHQAEWRQLQELSRELLDPGRFTPILGYEWSAFHNRGGHHNVFFRRPAGPFVSAHDADRLPALYRALRARSDPGDLLVIPHAHEAGDWTQSDPEMERLVELYSQHGSFEWFANRYLRNGFRVGVVAASDTHHSKPGLAPGPLVGASQPGGLAAVLAPANDADALFDALRARAAYATSGQRILLAATVNGHPMGTAQPAHRGAEIRVQVSGTAPIERIDIVRNGEVILSRPYAAAPLGSRVQLQVGFDSTSDPLGDVVRNPRGYRHWTGTVEVEGARLVDARPIGLDHRLRERVTLDRESRVARFDVLTRGRADSILLELAGASPATSLHFRIEASRQTSAVSSLLRGDEVPAVELATVLGELRQGRVEHPLPVGEHADRLWIQSIDARAPLDRELSYTDLEGGPGDYYYVRVTQLDGGRAWSSPFWIDDEP